MEVLGLLRKSPLTILFSFCLLYCILLLRPISLSSYTWALVHDDVQFQMAVEDGKFDTAIINATAFETISLFLTAAIIFSIVKIRYPLPVHQLDPDSRAVDVESNRFIAIQLLCLGAFLVIVPDGAMIFSGATGIVCLLLGCHLFFRPYEDRILYTCTGRVFEGGSASQWEGDPMFRAWAEKLKNRFARSAEEQRKYQQRRKREEQEYERKRDRARSRARTESSSNERDESRTWTVDDPWAILGLEPGTPMKKITQKYRRLCKRYHPDVVPQGLKHETEEAVKKINVAYRMIKEKRKPKTN